jgi:hypothetical protein
MAAATELSAQRRVVRILEAPAPPVAGEDAGDESGDGADGATIEAESDIPLFFLRDKSKVAGLPRLDAIRIRTRYGTLSVPKSEIVRLRLVRRVDPEVKKRVAAIIAKLGDDDFDVREGAMDEARAVGPQALPLLRQAMSSDNEEIENRAEILVDELEETAADGAEPDEAGESLSGIEDEIITTRMTIRGAIELEEIIIASQYGDLRVDIADIASASFQQAGPSSRSVDVEPSFQPPGNWFDAKLTIARGQQFRIEASGTVHVSNYGISSGPEGNRQYSGSTFNNFPMLALVGKVGKKGKPFLVGPNYKGKATSAGPLYLSIVPFQYNPAGASGKYTTKVRLLAGD